MSSRFLKLLTRKRVIIGVLYSGKMSAARALCGIKSASEADEIEVLFHIGRATSEEAIRWKNAAYAAFHLSKSRDDERAEICTLAKYMRDKSSANVGDSYNVITPNVK